MHISYPQNTRQHSFCMLRLVREIILYRYFTKVFDNETIQVVYIQSQIRWRHLHPIQSISTLKTNASTGMALTSNSLKYLGPHENVNLAITCYARISYVKCILPMHTRMGTFSSQALRVINVLDNWHSVRNANRSCGPFATMVWLKFQYE